MRKYLKVGFLVILALVIILPTILYVSAIDWSKKHSTRVAALPLLNDTANDGEYRLRANNLEFLVRIAGMQNNGPAVILLHGFPESSLMWQPLLDQAAAEGFRALAFDQRGYSPNARPKEVAAYHVDRLVEDVLAVADQVGFDTFHLVGHDWGAGVGWKTVMDFPERIRTWTAMSIPHTAVFYEAFLNHPEQQKRSAYIKQFQRPFLPELLFHLNQEKVADGLRGRWTEEQIAECMAIQREYGAVTGAFNWYRAAEIEKGAVDPAFQKKIHRPTLFIWGTKDPVVAHEIIPLQKKYMQADYEVLKVRAGHSLLQARTDSIITAVLGHFGD
ncbi:MAG: alpha/beta hydrolase [Bacteroidota bacterium]